MVPSLVITIGLAFVVGVKNGSLRYDDNGHFSNVITEIESVSRGSALTDLKLTRLYDMLALWTEHLHYIRCSIFLGLIAVQHLISLITNLRISAVKGCRTNTGPPLVESSL